MWIGGPRYQDMSALPKERVVVCSEAPPTHNVLRNPIRSLTSFDRQSWDQIADWMLAEAKKHNLDAFGATQQRTGGRPRLEVVDNSKPD